MSKKISIITFGCTVNISDSELMAGLLQDEGYQMIEDPKKADLLIINTCTVKNSAESKLFRALNEYKDKRIIISGCIPQAEKSLIDDKLKDYSVLGTKQLVHIVQMVDETLKGNRIVMTEDAQEKRLLLPKMRHNRTVEIIPINEGCVGSCAYCKTKHARGHVNSYPEMDILEQVRASVDEGITQVWLTSQDTGAYGKDTGTTVVELLRKILTIEGDYRIRLGMINPNHAKEYLPELVEIFKDERMFKFIHIPIQSASNQVLSDMNRNYTREDFEEIIAVLKERVPGITIATDIIIGYPTEKDVDFKRSYDLVKKVRPQVLNMSRFWPRPKTPAAELKPLDSKLVKNRSKRIKELFEKQTKEDKKQYLGQKMKVLVEDNQGSQALAKTINNLIVLIDKKLEIGRFYNVRIVKTDKWHLIGEIF